MNQVMNVRFLHDSSDVNRDKKAVIEFNGKTKSIDKEELLDSLEKDIAMKGFIVNNDISRQNVGDYVYYQFFYFDGKTSRNMQLQVSKEDIESKRRIEHIRTLLENEVLKQQATKYQNLKVFGKKALATILVGGFVLAGTFGMTLMFVNAWEKELESQEEYLQSEKEFFQSQVPEEIKESFLKQELKEQFPEIVFEEPGKVR